METNLNQQPTIPPSEAKKFPIWAVILLSILVTGFIVGFAVYYFVSKNNKSISETPTQQPKNNNQIITPPQEKNLSSFSIISDQKLFDGSFYIQYTSWSPNSDKFFVTRDVGTTDIGLPEYLAHDVFDINQKFLGKTNIKDGLVPTTPFWFDDNTLVTENKIANVSDVKNITLRDNISQTPSGYALLEEVKYYNPNTKESKKWVDNLTFSPDKKYAAFFSAYGSETKNPSYDYQLFIMPQGAKSLSELINFGHVSLAVESSAPAIAWSKNGKYIIVGDNEVFDINNRKAILPVEAGGGYHRRLTYLSPDETKALVIANFQDRTQQQDYIHETVRIFIKNLITGQETEILSTDGRESEIVHLDGGFSPDGKFVVFNSNKQLWIVNTATGEKKQLTTEIESYSQPRWSNNGKKIIYSLSGKEIRLIELGS